MTSPFYMMSLEITVCDQSSSLQVFKLQENCKLIAPYVAHETAAFLTWHRYFVHLYESILRDECDYKGPLP